MTLCSWTFKAILWSLFWGISKIVGELKMSLFHRHPETRHRLGQRWGTTLLLDRNIWTKNHWAGSSFDMALDLMISKISLLWAISRWWQIWLNALQLTAILCNVLLFQKSACYELLPSFCKIWHYAQELKCHSLKCIFGYFFVKNSFCHILHFAFCVLLNRSTHFAHFRRMCLECTRHLLDLSYTNKICIFWAISVFFVKTVLKLEPFFKIYCWLFHLFHQSPILDGFVTSFIL